MLRGQINYPFEYTDSGVKVLPRPDDNSRIKTADELVFRQYLATTSNEKGDIDLFARMSFEYLRVACEDAPPESADDPMPRERFHITHKDRQAIVFCLEFDALFDIAAAGQVALRSLAHARLHGPGWGALCIVHHQRHLAAELREVERAIPDDVNGVANDCGITLVTALDLQLLVRGAGEYQWDADQIRDLLFLPGRQAMVPPAYRRVGTYVRFYGHHSVMSVQLNDGERISVGDTLGIRLAARYYEEMIESLQVEHESLSVANGPCKVGIKTKLREADLDVGQAVFIRTRGN